MPKRLSTTSTSIPATFTDTLPLPSLIVFDLDYTLWPFWVDTHVSPPLQTVASTNATSSANTNANTHSHTHAHTQTTYVIDSTNSRFTFYPSVPAILRAAHDRGIAMGVASRTHAPELAHEMLRGLTLPALSSDNHSSSSGQAIRAIDVFTHTQIFPGSKTSHFQRIQAATRKAEVGGEVAFADMLFFDDEGRNRNVETELGVAFWLVRNGVSSEEVDKGVWEWRRRKGIQQDGARAGG